MRPVGQGRTGPLEDRGEQLAERPLDLGRIEAAVVTVARARTLEQPEALAALIAEFWANGRRA